jgi:hypothetical protein
MLAESDGDQTECVAGYMAYDLEDTSGLPIWILGMNTLPALVTLLMCWCWNNECTR